MRAGCQPFSSVRLPTYKPTYLPTLPLTTLAASNHPPRTTQVDMPPINKNNRPCRQPARLSSLCRCKRCWMKHTHTHTHTHTYTLTHTALQGLPMDRSMLLPRRRSVAVEVVRELVGLLEYRGGRFFVNVLLWGSGASFWKGGGKGRDAAGRCWTLLAWALLICSACW